MSTSVFYNFFSATGHNTYISETSEWVEIQRGMLLSVPFHRMISPSESEIDKLIAENHIIGVRYPTFFDQYGFSSTLAMCRKTDYGMSDLSSKARNQVRKGEKNFEIRRVSHVELLIDGLVLNRKTLDRQKRKDPKSNKEVWDRICTACFSLENIKVFGAFLDSALAAYMIVLETPGTAEIIIQNSDSDLLHLCPNNILTFSVTKYYLSSTGPALPVCYGLGSLEVTHSLDHFKSNMGYLHEPIKQRIIFNSKIRPFLKSGTMHTLNFLQSYIFDRSYFFRKCRGLLSCYLNQTTGY